MELSIRRWLYCFIVDNLSKRHLLFNQLTKLQGDYYFCFFNVDFNEYNRINIFVNWAFHINSATQKPTFNYLRLDSLDETISFKFIKDVGELELYYIRYNNNFTFKLQTIDNNSTDNIVYCYADLG